MLLQELERAASERQEVEAKLQARDVVHPSG